MDEDYSTLLLAVTLSRGLLRQRAPPVPRWGTFVSSNGNCTQPCVSETCQLLESSSLRQSFANIGALARLALHFYT